MCSHLSKQEYTQYVIESRMLRAVNPVRNSPESIRLDFITRRIEAYTAAIRHERDKIKTANPYRLVEAPLVKNSKHHEQSL